MKARGARVPRAPLVRCRRDCCLACSGIACEATLKTTQGSPGGGEPCASTLTDSGQRNGIDAASLCGAGALTLPVTMPALQPAWLANVAAPARPTSSSAPRAAARRS
jgi:hypothetical protein